MPWRGAIPASSFVLTLAAVVAIFQAIEAAVSVSVFEHCGEDRHIVNLNRASLQDGICLTLSREVDYRRPILLFAMFAQPSYASPKCPWFSFGSLSPLLHIMRRLMEGLEYLHTLEIPIKHKDIKAENILLRESTSTPFVEPIIIDFGISKEVIPSMDTTDIYTYTYRPPEQAQKQPTTTKSDVFCLGCVFTMIEGIMLDGQNGGRIVYGKATQGSACFADNLGLIHHFLDNQVSNLSLGNSLSSSDSNTVTFHIELRKLVKEMVERSPYRRPDITSALNRFVYIETFLGPNEAYPNTIIAQTSKSTLRGKTKEIQEEFKRKVREKALGLDA